MVANFKRKEQQKLDLNKQSENGPGNLIVPSLLKKKESRKIKAFRRINSKI